MRVRGAKIADIAILVVAADDGPMPQTKEAIKYIKEAGSSMIVAITKTDLPSADVDKAITALMEEEVLLEGFGGDTPYVKVSSKTGEGIDDLLEMIDLVSQVNEITADPEGELDAVVIETNKDNRGPLVSLVVRNGTLKQGEELICGAIGAKARGLIGENAKQIKEARPADPVLILGFSSLPEVGSHVTHGHALASSNEVSSPRVPKVAAGQLPIVLKAQKTGSLEALKGVLPKDVVVVRADIGDVTDGDIFFAKAAEARVIAFECKVPSSVGRLAETESVRIETFNIIYKLKERLEELLNAGRDEELGKAEVLAVFPFNNQQVAGCKVLSGKITKGDRAKVFRGEREIGIVKVTSVRRGKEVIAEAKAGEECGVLFTPQLDFEVGDMILSVK